MSGFDLQHYLERFPEICRAKFGRTYNFGVLEKEFAQLRQGARWLAARDVLKLFDPERTPFAHYWQEPAEKELNRVLTEQRLRLTPAEPKTELIARLLGAFHNIGVVSLILRFAHPDVYGVFSTPVMNLLQVQRGRAAELYAAYCDELAAWRQHFRMPTVAATELALWTFHEVSAGLEHAARSLVGSAVPDSGGPASGGESAPALREFEENLWIQRRRVAFVLRPFFQRYGPLELARILVYEDPKLAGKIAAEEYERLMRVASILFYRVRSSAKKGWAETFIDRLAQDGHISWEQKSELRKIWEIRNRAIHPGPPPAPEEVEVMIDRIEAICRPWGNVAKHARGRPIHEV